MEIIDPLKINRILVRVTNWLGDAVMNTPAMGAIRATFPKAEIVVVANPVVAEIFTAHPYCDRVTVFDKKGEHRGIAGMIRFARVLRRERFDLAILLQKAIEAAVMAFLAGVPRRVGYRTDGRGLLLTHSQPFTREIRTRHQSEHYLHLLRSFGISGGGNRQKLQCTEEELLWADERLGRTAWAAVNPGAAYGSAKRWFPERFAEVGDRLASEYGFRILLTGGPGEQEIGRDIEAAMASKPLNLIGKTSVRQMMALLSRCGLMVTNDSGPMHVAAALRVPIVAIFGSTDHTTTFPLADKYRIVRHTIDCAPCLLRMCPTDHRCMEMVSADDVLAAVRELI
jgi:heptosyltransferase II